jgi:hypothetical protein
MCTPVQLGPALLYLLVTEFGPLLLLSVLLAVPPSVCVLRRLGANRALAALSLFPVVGPVVLLGTIAYSNWPKVRQLKSYG